MGNVTNACCSPQIDLPPVRQIGGSPIVKRKKFTAFAELQKLLDRLSQDNLGLYRPSILRLPANAEIHDNYRGHLTDGMKNGVGKLYEMNQEINGLMDNKEMKMQFGNYLNDQLNGYGMEVIVQDNPDRRMFSLSIGDYRIGSMLQGFYLKALVKTEAGEPKSYIHFFKGTFEEDGLLKFGFRKELQGLFNQYEGSFDSNKYSGKAKTRILAFPDDCEYQLYEGEYKNSRKNGMGKLTIFKDIQSRQRIKFEQERSKTILQLVESDKFNFQLVLQLLRDMRDEKFDESIPPSAKVTTTIEVPWVEGKANGVGEECKLIEGSRYIGMFRQNEKNGYGEETKGETIRKGFFENGRFKKSGDTNGKMEYYTGGTQLNGEFRQEWQPKGQ